MRLQRNREDLSRFLVHLTKDSAEGYARDNLISILQDQIIYARNAHCLVHRKLKRKKFDDELKNSFNTVCFTEAPLTQIQFIGHGKSTGNRSIQLKPYGLVFWKEDLFEEGASPAIYINAKGTSIKQFLLGEFDNIFKNIENLAQLEEQEGNNYKSIVHYFSLINVVQDNHDFLWEREWRYHGNFKFQFRDIVAIIAEQPGEFEEDCIQQLTKRQQRGFCKIPVIDPRWTYEELVEKLSEIIWDKLDRR